MNHQPQLHIFGANRIQTAHWFSSLFPSQVKGQHVHTTPATGLVLPLKAPPFHCMDTEEMGLWCGFLFTFKANHSLQQLDYKEACTMRTGHRVANTKSIWIPWLYWSDMDSWGEVCPGDPSKLVDSSGLDIVKRRPHKHHTMSWFFFFFF